MHSFNVYNQIIPRIHSKIMLWIWPAMGTIETYFFLYKKLNIRKYIVCILCQIKTSHLFFSQDLMNKSNSLLKKISLFYELFSYHRVWMQGTDILHISYQKNFFDCLERVIRLLKHDIPIALDKFSLSPFLSLSLNLSLSLSSLLSLSTLLSLSLSVSLSLPPLCLSLLSFLIQPLLNVKITVFCFHQD